MNKAFPEIKKNFGFGCMRLPMQGDSVDRSLFNEMVDAFIESGFNYFDTAHGYVNGLSELAVKDCLTSRYPRDKYLLADKLSSFHFEKQEDIRPLFFSELEACGVDYFDFFLLHSQNAVNYKKYKRERAYETVLELKAEGKIKHVGLSFHDKAELLEEILTDYPQMEFVQIQFNYVDIDDASIESGKCYEVCRKYNKPVIVMEPVKGGALVNLPKDALNILSSLNNGSAASYALRYCAGFDGVFMTLSGMSDMAQLRDNIRTMKDFKPLDEREIAAIEEVRKIYKMQDDIKCTSCRYCVDGCPSKIRIPDLFSCYNSKKHFDKVWNANFYYLNVYTAQNGKASDCIGCGKCEQICPQHLKIRDLLKSVAAEFES